MSKEPEDPEDIYYSLRQLLELVFAELTNDSTKQIAHIIEVIEEQPKKGVIVGVMQLLATQISGKHNPAKEEILSQRTEEIINFIRHFGLENSK